MDRLISFLVLLPFLVYLIIPIIMLAAFYIKKSSLSRNLVKFWSIGFSLIAVASTFALMVISAQADLAFNSGKIYLTEPLTQLSLATQVFGVFILNSVFIKENDDLWFHRVIKTMFSLGALTYLIFSNQFLSVFLGLIALLIIAPTIKIRTKQILSGVILGLVIFLYSLSLEFSKSFAEIRLSLLSGEVSQWAGLAIVFVVLIFMLLTTLTVVSKDKKLDFFDRASWLLLSPVPLILCFYRLIQLGFISVDNITYDFSQWFLVFYLILFVCLIYLKRFSITGIILATSAGHTMLSMLFALSGADDFSFSIVSVHFYMVSSTVFLIALYYINKVEDLKGAAIDHQDIQVLINSKSSRGFVVFSLILFASALPPGPLFLVTYSGVQSLIEVGLYWTTLWSLVGLSFLGYFLFTSFSTTSMMDKASQENVLELWRKRPETSVNSEFKEVIFVLVCFLTLYGVSFLNL